MEFNPVIAPTPENRVSEIGRRRFSPLAITAAWLALLLSACAAPGFESVSPLPAPYSPAPAQPGRSNIAAITEINPGLLQAQAKQRKEEPADAVRQLFGPTPRYTIGSGDVVGIIVYDHPELLPNAGAVIAQQADPTGVTVAPGFIVSASGDIAFPYIGRTRLAGLTEIEASDLISRQISSFIREPQVTVRIQAFRSQRVYVDGEVRLPGIQIFTDIPMTMAEAISRAGGITQLGDRSNVTLTRSGATTLVSLPQLQALGLDAGGIPLRSGDLLNIRSRDERRVYVMGEVVRPSALQMRNGRLSLNEAIGDAGGVSLISSQPGQIYVIRSAPEEADSIFHLDARNPAAFALAERFELTPRDVVYVDSVPLVQWNRVVSLILPAAQVVNLGNDTTRR